MAMTLFRHALTICAWGYRLPHTTDITTQTEHLIYMTVLFCLIWIINWKIEHYKLHWGF